MANQILLDDYRALSSTHSFYTRNRDRWQFLYESYVGGEEYRRSAHLTRYQLETEGEYNQRLRITPLDNHCQSVVSTYISFLFREEPEREFYSWAGRPDVEAFLRDADHEGRSFDSFMKQVAIWTSVFGHSWVIMTKPNVGQVTQADEQLLGVRPYVNLLTPLVVSDWRWERQPNGEYKLVYFKYIEEVMDQTTVIKEWTPETIKTWIMNDLAKEAYVESEEPNLLGMIPAVLAYNQKSVVKDLGVSDITDIADLQRQIYNLHSENDQAIRLGTHPTLVAPTTAQIGSGAGAMILMQEGSDPGLNPYALEFSGAAVGSIHSSIDKLVEAIDRISFTGGVRSTVQRTMSGIAMETEFQLLNAKLSEKADQLELTEEQLWRLFARYQGLEGQPEIEYPDSFSIRDDQREFSQLAQAKSASTSPEALAIVDFRVRELLEDPTLTMVPESPELESEMEQEAVMPGTETMTVTEEEMAQPNLEGLQPEQIAQYQALEAQVQQFGQYDKGIGSRGAHYAEQNPFNSQGINCGNCVFYANNACEIVAGNIQPGAVCKFWIIPENKLSE